MSVCIVVLRQVLEDAETRLTSYTARQKHDIDYFRHQERVFKVLRIAEEDEEIVCKVLIDALKNL